MCILRRSAADVHGKCEWELMTMITCDCEIYEICPSCAPSQAAFDHAVEQRKIALRDAEILPPPSPSYTLAEIELLAEKYVVIHGIKDDLTPQLFLSLFLEWLKRREKEEGGR